MSALVRSRAVDGVATLTLDSPSNRNALSTQLRRDLIQELDRALADEEVRVVVLTHTGTVFCSGMDLKESRGAGADLQGVNEIPRILETLRTSPKPIVARVTGAARAGGIGLIAACDIVVAAESVTFAFSEVRLGLVPAVISLTVLPRLLPAAAHELFLTGETFDAARAVAIGLVNRAVVADDVDAEVARYVDMLRRGAPHALTAAKDLLRRSTSEDLREDYAAMNALSAQLFAGDEAQEGLRAFAEKREPAWACVSDDSPIEEVRP